MAGLKLKKVLLYALVILLVLYSLFFIGWNVHTLGNYTETEDGGTIPLNPKLADPCGTSENAFGSYQPIRFRINQDSGDYLYCSWKFKNDVCRFAAGVLGIATAVVAAIGMWKFQKMYLWTAIAACGVLALLFILITYWDASDVAESRSWCSHGMSGVKWRHGRPSIFCNYTPYIITTVLDGFSILLWAGTGALLYIYMEKWMLKIKFISRDRSAYSGIIQEWEG